MTRMLTDLKKNHRKNLPWYQKQTHKRKVKKNLESEIDASIDELLERAEKKIRTNKFKLKRSGEDCRFFVINFKCIQEVF